MDRRPEQPRRPREDGVPDDLRAIDSMLSDALAEWARSDAARTDRIHRATVGGIGRPAVIGRTPAAGIPTGWRWALAVGGGLAAAAMVTLVLRSGSEPPVAAPARAPVVIAEASKPAVAVPETDLETTTGRSAAEPVLVALIERDASRWSEDWTADDSFGHSSAWAGVVPLLETRDTGFDTVAGELGAILGGVGGTEASIR